MPEMCIIRDPTFGALPYYIPVLFTDMHRCTRMPFARELAFILAYAQQRFRDPVARRWGFPSVRVVVLRFSQRGTCFFGADVSRAYLEGVERRAVAPETLEVWRSAVWDLRAGEGRWGFFVGLKMALEKMFPALRLGWEVGRVRRGRKRKWEEIS